eukprot:1310376-Pyramimonas_sp.AAC.2
MPLSPLGRSIILLLPSSPSIQVGTVGCSGSPSVLPKFVSMANLPRPPFLRKCRTCLPAALCLVV